MTSAEERTRRILAEQVAEPPSAATERDMLGAFLQRQRDLVAWKLQGLPDDDARRVTTPTGLTVHGLVHHLQDVERSWVRRWFAGEPDLPVLGRDENWVAPPSTAPDGLSLTDLLAAYADESRRCDEVIAAHGLDDVAAVCPRTLRWILHHLIEETARHLGQLDLLRETADGHTGEAPGLN